MLGKWNCFQASNPQPSKVPLLFFFLLSSTGGWINFFDFCWIQLCFGAKLWARVWIVEQTGPIPPKGESSNLSDIVLDFVKLLMTIMFGMVLVLSLTILFQIKHWPSDFVSWHDISYIIIIKLGGNYLKIRTYYFPIINVKVSNYPTHKLVLKPW